MKISALVLLFVFLQNFAFAQGSGLAPDQNTTIERFSLADNFLYPKFWINIGSSFSNVSPRPGERQNGMYVGFGYEFIFTPVFAFQTGLEFVAKGHTKEENAGFDWTYTTLTRNYAEIPFLFKAKIGNRAKLVFVGGGYVGHVISQSGVVTGTYVVGPPPNASGTNVFPKNFTPANTSGLKRYDAGLRFGGGVEIPVGKLINVWGGAYYDWGLIDTTGKNTHLGGFNRAFIGNIGFGFPLDIRDLTKKL